MPLASAFLISSVGMALLAHVGEDGTYLRNVLPGMLVAGSARDRRGLGLDRDPDRLPRGRVGNDLRPQLHRHEIGGTIGIAVFSTIARAGTGALGGAQAATGISHASWQPGLLATLAAWSPSSSPACS